MKNKWHIKKILEKLIVIILIAILILPFVYIFFPQIVKFFPQPSNSFWDSSIGNFLATVLALVGGIPIALWVDRFIKRKEEDERIKIDRSKEKKILTLINEELYFNLNSLFLQGKKGNTVTMAIQPLKSDLWEAFIASEEVKYIDEANLLNRITSAYYVLKIIKDIEQQAYIALRTSSIVFTSATGVRQNAAQLLLKDARTFDKLFEDNISYAIKEINNRLKELKKHES